jgi:small subunit ribosomal protein S17
MADENVNENEIDQTQDEPVEAAEPTMTEPISEAENAPEATAEPVAEADEPAPEVEAEPITEEEPAAEPEPAEEPAEEPAAEAEAAPEAAAVSAPKKKKKRLPRALRPQRTRVTREKAAERKSITRLPKPEHARGRRQERQGAVVSAAGDKTIVVRVDTAKAHPMYKKVIRRSTRLHAHDEANEAKVGDIVRIVETRPLSKLKRWRLQEIVEAAK